MITRGRMLAATGGLAALAAAGPDLPAHTRSSAPQRTVARWHDNQRA